MSTKYKGREPHRGYFITLSIVGWIDVFTRPYHKNSFIESLKFCQINKGLEIYAYCIMTNHVHLICQAVGELTLAEIMRDLKKYTSKLIVQNILKYPESRREWMLEHFQMACLHLKRSQDYKVWQTGYHAIQVYSPACIQEKLQYIHMNPVQDMIVQYPEDYLYSSARNYVGKEAVLEIVPLLFY